MKQRRIISVSIAVLILVLAVVLLASAIHSCGGKKDQSGNNGGESSLVESGTNGTLVKGQPAKATLLSSGDYLIHKEIFDNVRQSDGSYDFNSIFEYVKDEITAADYALCNFEFAIIDGTDYTFYPHFRLPASTVDALTNAGFDFCITANNHSGDDWEEGIYRTVKTLREKGLKTTGTFETPDEKKYDVVDVNGIKIGIVNYTFGTIDDNGLKALNGNAALDANASQCINVFQNEKLDLLYKELDDIYSAMKADGAEAAVAYMHWGNEFQLTQTSVQEEIAQKLCDLGFNAIIGGHPHVIQPSAVLESTTGNGHKAFCLYSTGNMVSNQRREYMSASPNGYTEDAIFVYTTFERDNDGNVTLTKVDYTPVWMNKYAANGRQNYRLVPLSDLSNPSSLGLTDNSLARAKASKDRTDNLVSAGFQAYN